MDQRSVFFEEWLRSLREQYKHVVRSDDQLTLRSLTAVMHNVGFGEDELAQLRLEATMHVDDVGTDYVADINNMERALAAQSHPAECVCPQCMTIDESQFDSEGQPISPDPEMESYETGHVFPAAEYGEPDEMDETEPVTFEDSLATAKAQSDGEETESPDDDGLGEPDEDSDAPSQMSMF